MAQAFKKGQKVMFKAGRGTAVGVVQGYVRDDLLEIKHAEKGSIFRRYEDSVVNHAPPPKSAKQKKASIDESE